MKSYEEEIEREKHRECQKALERQKIAKGMMSTREDEKKLREMQRMQMLEKKMIEQEQQGFEMMWHRVLVEDVRRKEERERRDFMRRQNEMLERRRAYEEQIASANRQRQEAIRAEREKENMKFERIRKKMEQDYYEEINKKREQQQKNKTNYIEGHEMKMTRIQNERMREREIDNGTISVALEELRKERQRRIAEMHRLQTEKQVFTQYHSIERKMASALEEEADRIAREWKREDEIRADKFARHLEEEKKENKLKEAEKYRNHLEKEKRKAELERRERMVKMESVKRNAYEELRRKLDSANMELQKQMEYRECLSRQIRDNQRALEIELQDIENKQRPFTRKAETFEDAMEHKVDKSPCRNSTNPVHPFKRVIENKQRRADHPPVPVQLPLIGKRICN